MYGPGPIIHGVDVNDPTRIITQRPGENPTVRTRAEVVALPIRAQWFTGTTNGLLASWPSREMAEEQAAQRGVLVGQVFPLTVDELTALTHDLDDVVVVLVDAHGRPLRGER